MSRDTKTKKQPSVKKAKRVTIRDVAKKADVHISTVSRVLNPSQRKMVSDEVVERVQKIAKEMGYRANPFGYGLRTSKSNMLAVVIPDLANPIFTPIVRGVEQVAQAAGYSVMFADTNESSANENLIVERILSRHLDGLILATAYRDSVEETEKFLDNIPSVPTVLVNRITNDQNHYSVSNDDFIGAKLAVEHLINLGHTRIAHLAGPQHLSTGYQRKNGYLAALKDHGISIDENLIISGDNFGFQDGQNGFQALHEGSGKFSAIFAANDFIALGCYKKMREYQIDCPKDVSIVGYNDMPFANMFHPALTTVKIDLRQMGVDSAKLLLNMLDGKDSELESVILKPNLVIRGSTRAI